MITLSKRPLRRAAGNALIVTVMTMAIVGVWIGLALQYTDSVGRNVRRSILLRQATNIGDSSTEMAFAAWRSICRTNQTKVFKNSDFSGSIPSPTPADFPGVSQYTLTNFTVRALDSTWAPKAGGGATPAPIAGPNHGDLSYYYLATADVVLPTVSTPVGKTQDPTDPNNIVVRVRRVFQKETLSLWRYAIFFNDDLEIHPGAPMVVNGDVQTNGSLYTAHNTLTLNGKTTYVNSWSIGFMPGDGTHSETPSSPTWATGLPPAKDQAQQPYGVALTDYHQLIDYTTTPTTLDPYRLQSQAGVQVIIDAANAIQIYDGNGNLISTNGNGIGNGGRMKQDLLAAITTNETITDNREGATTGNASIRVATLDVGAVSNAIKNGDFGNNFNGIIYITDTSASADGIATKRAIRLKNGAKLPDGSGSSAPGLTIASANPVYVQGDYNTGSTPSAVPGATPTVQPPSNTGDPTQPTVAGYTRQPAAIIADAVNILSNSWIDSQSGTNPAAAPTTVNAGIISGNVPTGNGYYSGGVENFPRFLENWSGQVFTYYGSMIELYKSQQAIGHWGAANVYNPPNRAWYFDTNFISNPPPGLLASFNYRRSRWYTQ
ncbi:MAG: hypothetical protein H0X40_01405 [Chthoniobacterales bacterium]|nr:hypothetical protein [Chthoniobacterales bacterium]